MDLYSRCLVSIILEYSFAPSHELSRRFAKVAEPHCIQPLDNVSERTCIQALPHSGTPRVSFPGVTGTRDSESGIALLL